MSPEKTNIILSRFEPKSPPWKKLETENHRIGIILMVVSDGNVILWPDNNPKAEEATVTEKHYKITINEMGGDVLNGISGGRKPKETILETITREMKEEQPDLSNILKKAVQQGLVNHSNDSDNNLTFLDSYEVIQTRKGQEVSFLVTPLVLEVPPAILNQIRQTVKNVVTAPINEVLQTGQVRVNGKSYPVRPPALAALHQLADTKLKTKPNGNQ
ncbi:MAG: hypothetical protein GXP43_01310 [bacterium]|nr:hypothetical protein [bacterium]